MAFASRGYEGVRVYLKEAAVGEEEGEVKEGKSWSVFTMDIY